MELSEYLKSYSKFGSSTETVCLLPKSDPYECVTTIDRNKFDDGWVDSGRRVTFKEAIASLQGSEKE